MFGVEAAIQSINPFGTDQVYLVRIPEDGEYRFTYIVSLLGNYDCMVDWGDGSPPSNVTGFFGAEKEHNYPGAGDYIVRVSGLSSMCSYGTIPAETANGRIIEVIQLGHTGLAGGLLDSWGDLHNLIKFHSGDCDTSQVTGGPRMINNAPLLTDLDLTSMNMSSFEGDAEFLKGTDNYGTDNYNKILIAWSNQSPNLQDGVAIHMGMVTPTDAGLAAKQYLIDVHGWLITDALTPPPTFTGVMPDILYTIGAAIPPYDASVHFASGAAVDLYEMRCIGGDYPEGICINPTTGIISGTADFANTGSTTVDASNEYGITSSNVFEYNFL